MKNRRTLLGQVPAESPLYEFHPVTRLVSFLFFGIVPLFTFIPEINALLLLTTIAVMRWGRVDLSRLSIYLPIIFTVAFFMFTVVILAPGNDPSYTPIKVGWLTLYFQPVFFAFGAYWRLMAMLFGTILYFSTNRERDLLVALRSLRLPSAASYVLGLSIRSAGMFMEDFRTIREAERARGLDPNVLKLGDQIKLHIMYMVPLFSIALRRANEISNALFSRGYTISGRVGGTGVRSDYIRAQYLMRRRDWIAIIAMIVVFTAMGIGQLVFGLFEITRSPLNIYLRGVLNVPAY